MLATDVSIDRRGKSITTAVLCDAYDALMTMDVGQVLEIVVDDFEPFDRDITAWCRARDQRLVDVQPAQDGLHFRIQRKPMRSAGSSLAVVVSSDGLEELLSPLGFALASALDGDRVSILFQGPAVHVLAQGFKPKLRGWVRPFSRFAAAGLDNAGHVSAHEKLAQIQRLGGRIYACGPSMQRFKVKEASLAFDDVAIVEYVTFLTVMEHADATIYT